MLMWSTCIWRGTDRERYQLPLPRGTPTTLPHAPAQLQGAALPIQAVLRASSPRAPPVEVQLQGAVGRQGQPGALNPQTALWASVHAEQH